jgi:hypothetical protein
MSSSRALFDFCREQPLVLAGIGVAVGAALGAMLPATEAEDRLMGEASDDLKEKAQDFAGEQIEKAKAVGGHAYEAAGQEAQRQGLTGDACPGKLTELAETDCMAGHIGLELANPSARYLIGIT